MKTLCVIPARLQSTRLPRKMLQKINGRTMIEMTYKSASLCKDINKLVVATDSEEIADVVRSLSGEVMMTPSELPTGSDRTAFVAKQFPDMDVVINLQGDEPFIKPNMLSQLIAPFSTADKPVMSTLAFELLPEEHEDPNIVKVILDQQDNAIYFSRSAIPFVRAKGAKPPVLHHMGLYAYTNSFLQKFTQLAQTPLEKTELLEQLRAIEHGYKIRVCQTTERTFEINTEEELAKAQSFSEVA